jgi:hypothetical protein
MAVHIDEAWGNDQSLCIKYFIGRPIPQLTHFFDLSAPYGYITVVPTVAGAINDASISDQQIGLGLGA